MIQEDIKSKIVERYEELESKLSHLFELFEKGDSVDYKFILNHSKRLMEFVAYMAMYIRTIIPLSQSNDHLTKSLLNDFMLDLSSGSKIISSSLSEFLNLEKVRYKFGERFQNDQEASDVLHHDIGMIKQGLIGQNVQLILLILRSIKENVRLARILFGKEWTSKNCTQIEEENCGYHH